MMTLRVLGTGSSGNCYLLEADGETLIIDAGIRVREILYNVTDPANIAGCLITHEHKDHSLSALQLAKRGIDVIMSAGTANAIGASAHDRVTTATALKVINVGSFHVMPFGVEHDAVEPFGFLISRGSESAVYITDTYYCRYTFPGVNYWIVECNYCDDLISETNEALRKRLLQSHMSLRRLKDMLTANDLSRTYMIVLVHLSDSRSDERRMINELAYITDAEIIAATEGMTIELNDIPF